MRRARTWLRTRRITGATVNALCASPLTPRTVRLVLLRAFGADVRTRAISPGCFFGGPFFAIGRGTFVNVGCVFDNSAPITVGDRCALGIGTRLITSTHELGPASARAGDNVARPVRIEDGCWLGASVTVLPGVTIGRGCVVGAGAVVTRDCAPDGLYVGVPAVRSRELEPGEASAVLFATARSVA